MRFLREFWANLKAIRHLMPRLREILRIVEDNQRLLWDVQAELKHIRHENHQFIQEKRQNVRRIG